MSVWLHIIGVGEAGVEALPPAARLVIGYAETVIGPLRFLNEVESLLGGVAPPELTTPDSVTRRNMDAIARALLEDALEEVEEQARAVDPEMPELIEWEAPLERMIAQVKRLRDTPTVILATGDPMWYGIGATLARHLSPDEFEVHPHPAAFQLAAAALRWPLQNAVTLSLHGRPPELIQQHIAPGVRILALTTDSDTAQKVADILSARGYPESRMTVLENLGGPEERITSELVVDFDVTAIGDFYVLAIDCVAGGDALALPPVPGLPDEAFEHDGQLTKREIRAITLAKLVPLPGAVLWDVGAGSGSIAIEWMRAARDAEAVAFERDEDRLRLIEANARTLGVPHLRIEEGEAPASLAAMPSPDAIFLGGSVAEEALFTVCWNALKPGGRLVANAVTIDGEQALYARHAEHGGDLVRIETAVLDSVGEHRVLRPRMAVLQWSVTKPQQWLAAT